MFCGTWCTAFGGLAGHTECVNMLRWPLWALEKVRKMQTCEKDLDPNFALQPELNSHLELYITMASTSCITFSIFFLCVYILMCVHGCGHMSMPVCLPEVSTDCLPQLLFTLCFETGPLGEPGCHWSGDTSWAESFRDLLCLPPCDWEDRHTPLCLVFYMDAMGLNSSFHAYMRSTLHSEPSAQPPKLLHYTKKC